MKKAVNSLFFSLFILSFLFLIGWGVQRYFIHPLRIAMVNFTDANWAVWKHAADSTPYTLHRFTFNNLAESPLENYDVLVIWSRGWQPTPEQKARLDVARKSGTKVYTSATTLDESLNQMNIPEEQSAIIREYIEQGGSNNITALLHYFAREFKGYSVNVPEVLVHPKVGYFHLGEKLFENIDEYEQHLDSLSQTFQQDAPRIALFGPLLNPYASLERQPLDELINKLTRHGMRVYTIAGLKSRPELLELCNPDLAIYFPIGQMLPENEGSKILERLNIPCLNAIFILASREEWYSEPTAMSGAYVSLSTALPECDGVIEPTAISTVDEDENENGLKLRHSIPERIDRLVERVERWTTLRRKSNAEKRVAIVYYKAPGHSALTAQGLETVDSLYNTLKRLRAEGYDLGDSFPETSEELQQRIDIEGRTVGQWAVGALERFAEEGTPEKIPAQLYAQWFQQDVPKQRQKEVLQLWGNIPGKVLTIQEQNQSMLLVSRIRFGNIVILPQPTTAILTDEEMAQGNNDSDSIHGTQKPLPHFYIAPYLWIRHGFRADVIVHFGTHGSLEFTQGKSIALSDLCWSSILIGDLPHVYLYSINNIGEALLAKRRSDAVLVSHLTQSFTKSEIYGELQQICNKITDFETVEGELLKTELRRSISRSVEESGLFVDLDLVKPESGNDFLLDDKQIETVHQYLHRLESENVTDGLHVLGRSWTEEQIVQTVTAMLGDQAVDAMTLDETAVNPYDITKKKQEKLQNLVRKNLRTSITDWSDKKTVDKKTVDEKPVDEKTVDEKPSRRSSGRPSEQPTTPKIETIRDPLEPLGRYLAAICDSQHLELDRFLLALSGRFIPPSSGGDVVVNPNAAPTGRNIASIDVESTPSGEAWNVARRLTDEIIEEHCRSNGGAFPRRVACTFWGGEYIRTRGTIFAQALYLLGVRPVWNSRGSVIDFEVISSAELGRPRIDILVQTSGQFSDAAGSRIELLDKAVQTIAALPQELFPNYVKEHSLAAELLLKQKGLSAAESRELSTARIFGSPYAKNYGTGIMSVIERGDRWETENEIADKYISNMSGIYRNGKVWGRPIAGLLESQLQETDIVLFSRSSNVWGPLRLDHVYEFSTLALAVRVKTGGDPQIRFSDLRNPQHAKTTNAKSAIHEEIRTTLWNPKYIAANQREGNSAATQIVETIRNLYSWNVVQPSTIDASLWEETYRVYIEDKHNLNMKDYFAKQHPYALQDLTAIMLETIRKELWLPSREVVENLTELHTALVIENGAGCSYETCANTKLHDFIGNMASSETASNYQSTLNATLFSGQPLPEVEGIQLDKTEISMARTEPVTYSAPIFVSLIILFSVVILLMGFFARFRSSC
ncbi:MAG: cobaltochelatase subunit CobN [Planctomycetaceae bacterium]|nr:cobaltochelatase subunit CobN [Planctomycetaceae bacterium]